MLFGSGRKWEEENEMKPIVRLWSSSQSSGTSRDDSERLRRDEARSPLHMFFSSLQGLTNSIVTETDWD